MWQHRGSIVASHLSIPRSVRKASLGGQAGECVIEEEGGGLRPIWDALSELLNFRLLSNKFFLLIGKVSIHFYTNIYQIYKKVQGGLT